MVRNPWLTAPVTTAHEAIAQTMCGNMRNAFTFLKNLTGDDKNSCIKVGNVQLGMIDQIKRICVQHPDVMPRYHDLVDYYTKVESVKHLLAIRGELVSMLESIESTLTGAQDDTMRMSLDYYYSLKRASKSAMPGLHKQYMEVRENFLHESGQTPEEQFPEGNVDGRTPETQVKDQQ